MSKTKIFLTFLLSLIYFSTAANAETYDRAYLENLAKNAVTEAFVNDSSEHISITVSRLDPRLVIQPCDGQLNANIPEKLSGRNVNVKINCSGSTPWHLYVPVRLSVQAPALVAKQAISKDSVLTENNVEIVFVDKHQIRGEPITNINDVLGAKTKRNISQGKSINRRHICLVCKGDQVILEAASSVLSIKTAGTSLGNGHLGDKVRVKNNRSGKTVFGIIKGINKVAINL